jgi:hypothetical protein
MAVTYIGRSKQQGVQQFVVDQRFVEPDDEPIVCYRKNCRADPEHLFADCPRGQPCPFCECTGHLGNECQLDFCIICQRAGHTVEDCYHRCTHTACTTTRIHDKLSCKHNTPCVICKKRGHGPDICRYRCTDSKCRRTGLHGKH